MWIAKIGVIGFLSDFDNSGYQNSSNPPPPQPPLTFWNPSLHYGKTLLWAFGFPPHLVTSRAIWTLAWTEPSRSAPIFFSSWVSSTNSQSWRSSLCAVMKSTSVSRNMLNTWGRGFEKQDYSVGQITLKITMKQMLFVVHKVTIKMSKATNI